MKVALFGKASKNIEVLVKALGFEIVLEKPDVIISYGGDGTLLSSERDHPGIPKLPLRNSQLCKKCVEHDDKTLLGLLLQDKLQLKEYRKLEMIFNGKTLCALNDFVIRNVNPIHAIRFRVENSFYIGDGIIIATAFGSTGYFKSVTQKTFQQGFGLAFNNTTEKIKPLILNEKDEVKFQLVRGIARLTFDNNPEEYPIPEGLELIFKLSNQTAKIYEAQSLRCPTCQIIRD